MKPDVSVYKEMPAVWDPGFRSGFYQRWGRESAVISARARRVQYPAYRQLLSIKAAFGGAEDYFVDGRRLSVDDDTFAILNHDRVYSSVIDTLTPVHSLSIFFDVRSASHVNQSLLNSNETLLERRSEVPPWNVEFAECLHHHDRLVTPVLHHIRNAVDSGMRDSNWLDEQLLFLLERILRLHHNRKKLQAAIPSTKPSTRRELLRRLEFGIDFIHAKYRDPITLREIAAAAHLSPFHFLRTFKRVYGMTPVQFLNCKRAAAARRLLLESSWSTAAVAAHVGLGSRTSLFRHISAVYGSSPSALRGGGGPGKDRMPGPRGLPDRQR